MRILTVRQPWAWAIIHAGKNIENRQTNIAGSYRGPVAIHAAKALPTPDAWNNASDVVARVTGMRPLIVPPSRLGAIIGVVDLIDIHEDDSAACYSCTEWAEVAWHMVLANPRPLTEPIPYRGMLGLRRLDDETITRIKAAIA